MRTWYYTTMDTILGTKIITGPLSWKEVVVDSSDGNDVNPLLLHLGSVCVLHVLKPLDGGSVTVKCAMSDNPLFPTLNVDHLTPYRGDLTAEFQYRWEAFDSSYWRGEETLRISSGGRPKSLTEFFGNGCVTDRPATISLDGWPQLTYRETGWAGKYGYLSVTGAWPVTRTAHSTPVYAGQTTFAVIDQPGPGQ